MKNIFISVVSLLGYLFTGLIILGLVLSIPILLYYRKMNFQRLKKLYSGKEYVRILLIFLAVVFAYVVNINIALFQLGFTSNRFLIRPDYISALFFIAATVEMLIKQKELWIEVKLQLKKYPFVVAVFSIWYLLGGIALGSLVLGV